MTGPTIYFDHNATTPLDPAVREVMLPYLAEIYGNPSSVHHVGRKARAGLDSAREQVAAAWGSKASEVVFTSGGTESVNLAILGTARAKRDRGRHIITSAVEHAAVLSACEYLVRKEGFELTLLPVNREALVDLDALVTAIRPDTVLVSLMAANNEVGTIQPVADAGKICQERGVAFHTDASQWFGKLPVSSVLQFNADLVSVCSHKFYGPKGVGALFIKSPLQLEPIITGGGHENERRAGTENLPGIVGFAEALTRFGVRQVFDSTRLNPLSLHLLTALEALTKEGVVFYGSRSLRLCNTVSFGVAGVDSLTLLAALDLERICTSSGSACSSGSVRPSHVLKAMFAVHPESLVRFSLGRDSTLAEVLTVVQALPRVIRQARASTRP